MSLTTTERNWRTQLKGKVADVLLDFEGRQGKFLFRRSE